MPNPILKTVADNPALTEALKEVLLKQFTEPDSYEEVLSDELLGQLSRARIIGRNCIAAGFKEILSYKSAPERPDRFNEAR